MLHPIITIYTDGSCHTQQLVGAWAAIIFIGAKKFVLSGTEENTTHNRMELTAIIEALKFTEQQNFPKSAITIITDSQYAVGLQGREQKFTTSNFTTKNGNPISNEDLVKSFLLLLKKNIVTFEKIKAHLKQTDEPNYNIEVDKLSRNLVRQAIKTKD